MRILHVTVRLAYKDIPSRSFNIINALEQHGHRNFCLYLEGRKPSSPATLFQRKKTKSFLIAGIPSWIGSLENEMKKFEPDVVFIHHCAFPFTLQAATAAKLLRAKSLVLTDLDKYNFPSLGAGPYYFQFVMQLILADGLLCWTRQEKELILSRLKFLSKDKLHVFFQGINPRLRPREAMDVSKEDIILSVAKWSRRKNLHTIVKVFDKVLKEKDCKLVILGPFVKEGYRVEVEKTIKDLEIEDKVKFADSEELQEYYSKSKVFYLPSLETFGAVYIEALSFGLPVVAKDYKPTRELIRDGKTGFLKNSMEGQKKALIKLMSDSQLLAEIRKECLKDSKKYRWKNVVKRFEEIVERL